MALVIMVADRRRRAVGSCIEPMAATPVTRAMMVTTTMISMSVSPRRDARAPLVWLGQDLVVGCKELLLRGGVALRHADVVVGALLAVRPGRRARDLVAVARELQRVVPRILDVEVRTEELLLLELLDRGAVLAGVRAPPHDRGPARRVARGLRGPDVRLLLGRHHADRDGRREHTDDRDDDHQLHQRQTASRRAANGTDISNGSHLPAPSSPFPGLLHAVEPTRLAVRPVTRNVEPSRVLAPGARHPQDAPPRVARELRQVAGGDQIGQRAGAGAIVVRAPRRQRARRRRDGGPRRAHAPHAMLVAVQQDEPADSDENEEDLPGARADEQRGHAATPLPRKEDPELVSPGAHFEAFPTRRTRSSG